MPESLKKRLALIVGLESGEAEKGLNRLHRSIGLAADKIGRYAKLATMALAGIGTAATFAGSSFDKSMREVWTMLDISATRFKALSQDVLDLTLIIPRAGGDLARALYDVVSAQIPVNEQFAMMKQASIAAVGGVTDVRTAASALITVWKLYGDQLKSVEDASDILFQTVRLGRTTFGEMASQIGELLSLGKVAKVPLDELLTAFSLLTYAIPNTAEAVTSLARMIQYLAVPEDQAAEAMKRLGIVTRDLNGTLLPLDQILSQLVGRSLEDLKAIMPEIRGLRGLSGLIQSFDQFGSTLDQIRNRTGAAELAFKKLMDGFSEKIQLVKNATVAIGIEFFYAMEEALTGGSVSLQEQLKGMVVWVREHREKIAIEIKKVGETVRDLAKAIEFLGRIVLTHRIIIYGFLASLGGILVLNGFLKLYTAINFVSSALKLMIPLLKSTASLLAVNLIAALGRVIPLFADLSYAIATVGLRTAVISALRVAVIGLLNAISAHPLIAGGVILALPLIYLIRKFREMGDEARMAREHIEQLDRVQSRMGVKAVMGLSVEAEGKATEQFVGGVTNRMDTVLDKWKTGLIEGELKASETVKVLGAQGIESLALLTTVFGDRMVKASIEFEKAGIEGIENVRKALELLPAKAEVVLDFPGIGEIKTTVEDARETLVGKTWEVNLAPEPISFEATGREVERIKKGLDALGVVSSLKIDAKMEPLEKVSSWFKEIKGELDKTYIVSIGLKGEDRTKDQIERILELLPEEHIVSLSADDQTFKGTISEALRFLDLFPKDILLDLNLKTSQFDESMRKVRTVADRAKAGEFDIEVKIETRIPPGLETLPVGPIAPKMDVLSGLRSQVTAGLATWNDYYSQVVEMRSRESLSYQYTTDVYFDIQRSLISNSTEAWGMYFANKMDTEREFNELSQSEQEQFLQSRGVSMRQYLNMENKERTKFWKFEKERQFDLADVAKFTAKSMAASSVQAVADVLASLSQLYAVKAAAALAEVFGGDLTKLAAVAQWTAASAAAGAASGIVGGKAAAMQEGIREGYGGGVGGGGGMEYGGMEGGGAVGGRTYGSTVRAEPTVIHISPSISIEGEVVIVGDTSVDALEDTLGRAAVEAVKSAITTGEIAL